MSKDDVVFQVPPAVVGVRCTRDPQRGLPRLRRDQPRRSTSLKRRVEPHGRETLRPRERIALVCARRLVESLILGALRVRSAYPHAARPLEATSARAPPTQASTCLAAKRAHSARRAASDVFNNPTTSPRPEKHASRWLSEAISQRAAARDPSAYVSAIVRAAP